MDSFQPIGATPEELASRPGLLLDLSLSLVPRRLALCSGLLALMGGTAKDKVQSLISRAHHSLAILNGGHSATMVDRFRAARDLGRAVADLENAVSSLAIARLKIGARVVPTSETFPSKGGGL